MAGSGLGLSIGRWIADAHGAELTVESTPLRGSVFQIKFPMGAKTYSSESAGSSK
jgi:signal transduction histidine kinase